jgi:hypothetical protein
MTMPCLGVPIVTDSLHPILDYLALERGGFSIFRRFRCTYIHRCVRMP